MTHQRDDNGHLDPSAPLTTPHIGPQWALYDGHTTTWLSDIFEEVTYRLLGPLDDAESEMLNMLTGVAEEPDLDRRKRLYVDLVDNIGEVRFARQRIMFRLATCLPSVMPLDLIQAPDVMEYFTTRILAEMGAHDVGSADALLREELGPAAESVRDVIPELDEDWYTQRGRIVRPKVRRGTPKPTTD